MSKELIYFIIFISAAIALQIVRYVRATKEDKIFFRAHLKDSFVSVVKGIFGLLYTRL